MKLVVVLIVLSPQCLNVGVAFVDGQTIAKIKCDNYRSALPRVSERFSDNDEDAVPKEFPFMAKVENDTHFHNGILISENFVLTILGNFKISGKNQVILGAVNRRKDDDNVKYFSVVKHFLHPQYGNDPTFDILLLKLNGSVEFDDFIRPACLPQPETKISQELMEIGWSDTNVRNSYLLHKAKMYYVSNVICREKNKFVTHLHKIMEKIDNETILCATTKEGDREMCDRFVGSALLNRNRDTTTVSEVVGLGLAKSGCINGTYPTVFVQISASLKWIESIVWPNAFTTEALSYISKAESFPTNKTQMRTKSTSKRDNVLRLKTIVFSATIAIAMLVGILCFIGIYCKEKCFRKRKRTEKIDVNAHLKDGTTHNNVKNVNVTQV